MATVRDLSGNNNNVLDPHIATPGGSGSGGGASAKATAASPSYAEGATVDLSVDLDGNMRVIDGGVGLTDDTAWDGVSADASVISATKTIALEMLDDSPAEIVQTGYSVARTITPGTNVAAGRALAVRCTTAGTLTIELDSGNTLSFDLEVGPAFFDKLAVIDVAWSNSGAGTAYVLDYA